MPHSHTQQDTHLEGIDKFALNSIVYVRKLKIYLQLDNKLIVHLHK